MKAIVDSMAHVPKRLLSQADLILLKRRLTIIPRATYGEQPEAIILYQETENTVAIPREYFFQNYSRIEYDLHTSDGQPLQLIAPIKLKPEQIPMVADMMVYFKRNLGGLLCANAGSGKTVMSLEIARRIGRTTLVMVYKDDLADQWIDRIKQFMPNARVGRIQGDTQKYKDCDFVIAMIQTLINREYSFEVKNYFGLVIVDEAHRTGSKEWSRAIKIFNAKHRLLLTATPRRKDACENVFFYHGGRIAVQAEGDALKAEIWFKETNCSPMTSGRFIQMQDFIDLPPQIRFRWLSKNRTRNLLIANDIVKALKAGRYPFVLSHLTEHLQALQNLVREILLREELGHITTDLYVGEVYTGESVRNKKGKVQKIKKKLTKQDLINAKEADCLFATYKKSEDAFDHPKLDTLFMALPLSDPEQAVGRVCRPVPGKKPLVVDYTDDSVIIYRTMKDSRIKVYKQKQYTIKAVRG